LLLPYGSHGTRFTVEHRTYRVTAARALIATDSTDSTDSYCRLDR